MKILFIRINAKIIINEVANIRVNTIDAVLYNYF